MEPSASAEAEPKERRKIQFAVPASAAPNLDPRQVEMIRRRRPTPATLFRVSDHGSPEDEQPGHQWMVGDNGVLRPKRGNPHLYQPPSLKAVQKMAEAHMQNLGVCPPLEDPREGEEDHLWERTAASDERPEAAGEAQESRGEHPGATGGAQESGGERPEAAAGAQETRGERADWEVAREGRATEESRSLGSK
ncbi:protein phosphatase 1 regulatory subunit 1B isoform X1 [Stigmatopora argus]